MPTIIDLKTVLSLTRLYTTTQTPCTLNGGPRCFSHGGNRAKRAEFARVSIFKQRKSERHTKSTEKLRSGLAVLPTEVLQKIVGHLPLEAQACLILTCRIILAIVGTRPWEELRLGLHRHSRLEFLKLWVQDFEGFYACAPCNIAHGRVDLPFSRRNAAVNLWRGLVHHRNMFNLFKHKKPPSQRQGQPWGTFSLFQQTGSYQYHMTRGQVLEFAAGGRSSKICRNRLCCSGVIYPKSNAALENILQPMHYAVRPMVEPYGRFFLHFIFIWRDFCAASSQSPLSTVERARDFLAAMSFKFCLHQLTWDTLALSVHKLFFEKAAFAANSKAVNCEYCATFAIVQKFEVVNHPNGPHWDLVLRVWQNFGDHPGPRMSPMEQSGIPHKLVIVPGCVRPLEKLDYLACPPEEPHQLLDLT